MQIPIGTLVNVSGIITGTLIGVIFGKYIPERMQKIIFQGLGLSVMLLGLNLAQQGTFLIVCGSMILGSITGEILRIDLLLEKVALKLKSNIQSSHPGFIEGFITATMIFCIGSITVLGPLQEALEGKRTLLYTKAMLDFFTSLVLASKFGIGVIFSFVPLLFYQLFLFFFAFPLQPILPEPVLNQLLATGGVMIMGVSFSLLEIKKLNLANMLPSLFYAVILGNIFSV